MGGILKPRAGKHDTSVLATDSESDVGMKRVLLNRNKGRSLAAVKGCKIVNQAIPERRIFWNIIGEQGRRDGVSFREVGVG
jgi:hypothetical protein